ncbi:MAG: hypothetical protein K6B74_03670 [Ruminococcus sp.]|nr:hypothetical protein [Ruminococcus sp.]
MFVSDVKDKAVEFMTAHPKFTRYAVTGTTALATIGGSAVVASAEGETSGTTASTTDTVIDTIVTAMGDALSSVAGKVIPAAVGVGIVFVAASLAWRWFKRMAYN